MRDNLKQIIDEAIRNILKENPDTVFDKYDREVAYYADRSPAIAFFCIWDSVSGKHKWFINDKRNVGSAYHGSIRPIPTPDFPRIDRDGETGPDGKQDNDRYLRGRIWMDKKICSFYDQPNTWDDGDIDRVNELFEILKLDPKDFQFEYGNTWRTKGPLPWKGLNRSAAKAPEIELSPEQKAKVAEIKKRIASLEAMVHLKTGAEKQAIEKEIDELKAMIGDISTREAEKAAYRKASSEKDEPYRVGGGGYLAGYKGRLPAIAEEKVQIYNKTLCPLVWNDNKQINTDVRKNLLQIANDFYKNAELDAPLKDVLLLGSIANYNWTKNSDMDVHILVDGSVLNIPEDTREQFLRALVGKWNLEHEIKVKGHKVELYLQDVKEENAATGVYSLMKGQWVKEPTPQQINVDKLLIQKKYTMWVDKINDAISKKDDNKLKSILEQLRDYRQAGLDKSGEFSPENLTFKILRSRGWIEKLKNAFNDIYDKKMSVSDGFDPQSQAGPNTPDSDGDINGNFYKSTNSMMQKLEENGSAGMIAGGFGSGNRKEDRLAIKNKDGSLRRWQIRSKDVMNATPQMNEALQDLINETLDEYLPLNENEQLNPILKAQGFNYWNLLGILKDNGNDPHKAAVEATALRMSDQKRGDPKNFWKNAKAIIKQIFSGSQREQARILYTVLKNEFEEMTKEARIQREVMTEGKSPDQKTLKKNRKPLTSQERAQVMKAGAVWHHGPNGEKTPAVWKSVIKGKTYYCCNTHRAIQIKTTLKGAIKAFDFIKSTA